MKGINFADERIITVIEGGIVAIASISLIAIERMARRHDIEQLQDKIEDIVYESTLDAAIYGAALSPCNATKKVVSHASEKGES